VHAEATWFIYKVKISNFYFMIKEELIIHKSISLHIDRINICNNILGVKKSSTAVLKDDSYNLWVENQKENPSFNNSTQNKKKIVYSIDDQMSTQTQRKLQKAVRYLNFTAIKKKVENKLTGRDINFKIAFVTLTLPSKQVHSDVFLKNKLINHFLQEAKNKWKIDKFVWRIEKQSNGNSHFHFLFDQFIPHGELREVWNRICNKLGYVDRYTAAMSVLSFAEYKALYVNSKKATNESIRSAYKKGKATGWRYPNSTDVHSLLFINDIDSYLIKYLSKSEQNQGLVGRLWGCSHNLSNISGVRMDIDSQVGEELDRLCSSGCVRIVSGSYYEIIFLNVFILRKLNCVYFLEMLYSYLVHTFNFKSG